ncbi:MAG: hypothetical protein AAGG75_02010 [Bacteroidota bacterium]
MAQLKIQISHFLLCIVVSLFCLPSSQAQIGDVTVNWNDFTNNQPNIGLHLHLIEPVGLYSDVSFYRHTFDQDGFQYELRSRAYTTEVRFFLFGGANRIQIIPSKDWPTSGPQQEGGCYDFNRRYIDRLPKKMDLPVLSGLYFAPGFQYQHSELYARFDHNGQLFDSHHINSQSFFLSIGYLLRIEYLTIGANYGYGLGPTRISSPSEAITDFFREQAPWGLSNVGQLKVFIGVNF